MNRKRLGAQFVTALGLTALTAGLVASLGSAREGANLPPPGACPAEPAKELSIKFAVSYTRGGTLAGATYCKDGATASKITVDGKPVPDFKNGVCWRDSAGFHVTVGTVVAGSRSNVDPTGFELSDVPPSKYVKDAVAFASASNPPSVSPRPLSSPLVPESCEAVVSSAGKSGACLASACATAR